MNPLSFNLVLALLLLPAEGRAGDIYKCALEEGVLYSHIPCEPGAQPIDLPALGRLGSPDDFQALRSRVDELQRLPESSAAPARGRLSGRGRGLSYGERNELKKLRIRADGLRRDLGNWHRHSSYRTSLEAELDQVEARMQRLERKK